MLLNSQEWWHFNKNSTVTIHTGTGIGQPT